MNKKNHKKFFFFISLFLVFTPILYFFLNITLGTITLIKSQKLIEDKNYLSIKPYIKISNQSFQRSEDFFSLTKPVFVLIDQEKVFLKIDRCLNFLILSTKIASDSLVFIENNIKFSKNILQGREVNFENFYSSSNLQLESISQNINLLKISLTAFFGNEKFFGPYFLKTKQTFSAFSTTFFQGQEIFQTLPDLLGMNRRKTYLLLFQNNMEIRPTGGFIGSFGLISFEKGKLVNFEVQDVYFADGQLKGHVEAPVKIKEFLGSSGGWYLRDSNWDPDFPTSAEKGEWFLEKETGYQVDGVIAVDFFVLQRILEVLGEVNLVDYQTTITKDNFFEKSQFYNEVGFFPGSTQKKDFLGAVGLATLEKIKSSQPRDLGLIFLSILKSLEEKDILISFNNKESQKTIDKFNWDGGIKSVKCDKNKNDCLSDYLMLVEANVGVNKVNYFLNRSLSLENIFTIDGKVVKNLSIFYENQSPTNVFPGGDYKNYLRIYVPLGSIVTGCKIEDLTGKDGDKECKVDITSEHEKTIFGLLVEVPVGKKRKVEINWELSKNFSKGQYFFLVQKQSGVKNDNFFVSFVYPKSWQVFSKSTDSLTGEGKLIYNSHLGKDKVFDLFFN